MRNLILTVFTLTLLPSVAGAECWLIENLQGTAYFQGDGYSPVVDKISQAMEIRFDGDKTNVSGSQLPMTQIDRHMVVGMGKTDAFTTVETYQIDPVLGVSLYTKSISGRSIHSDLTGIRAFRGTARRCK